jgi:hypothetical protein
MSSQVAVHQALDGFSEIFLDLIIQIKELAMESIGKDLPESCFADTTDSGEKDAHGYFVSC